MNFFGDEVDVVFLNGGSTKVGYRLEDTKLKDFDEMLMANIRTYFLWLKKLLPTMKKQNFGQIIIGSSTLVQEPLGRCAVYCATKFALQGLIASLREELDGTKVKICVLHTDTDSAFMKSKSSKMYLTQTNIMTSYWRYCQRYRLHICSF
jgi:NADP-dependent 3-hydroxy acid dehydrogenase YdfG